MTTVIVPVHNAGAVLDEQLEALANQRFSGNWEVLIVDNGSTDDSVQRVRDWMGRVPGLRVVHAAERASAGYARNVGMEAARGDLLMFCDADDVADPNWVAQMVLAAPRADILGGRLEFNLLNDPVVKAWYKKTEGLFLVFGSMPCPSTANCAVWADVIHATGRWPEFDGAAGEDTHFAVSAQLAGYSVGYVESAVMHYRFRPTLRAMARQQYHYARSFPLLYRAFRGRGARRRSPLIALKVWLVTLGELPDLFRSAETRGAWIRRAARLWGRLAGSVRYRVFFL